jgi:NADH-quinone oxidoreductase subunit M
MIAIPFITIATLVLVRERAWILRIAFGATVLNLGLFARLWTGFDFSEQGMQFVERMEWMPTFGIQYAVGVDGISILMILLTTLLPPLCVLCSWKAITTKIKAFMMLILLVEGAMLVVFTALDLFLFFMLWEVTMIPMYFMIILWGGPGRVAAGLKFVLYSLTGSLLLLVGILGLHIEGGRTFDIATLTEQRCFSASPLSCRCFRFIRGCPMLTRRRRPQAASCSRESSSKWAATDCFVSVCPFFRKSRIGLPP